MKNKEKWNPELKKSHSKKFQDRKRFYEGELDRLFRGVIRGFISILVNGFFEGSVGVDYEIFVEDYSNVTEDKLVEVLKAANSSGNFSLNLDQIDPIRLEEEETSTSPPSPSKGPLNTWQIVLIVAVALVLTLMVVILILVVSSVLMLMFFLPHNDVMIAQQPQYVPFNRCAANVYCSRSLIYERNLLFNSP